MWISTLNLRTSFWQLMLDEDSRPLTSFSCTSGQFQWICMPMGLLVSSAEMQRFSKSVLKDFANSNTFEYTNAQGHRVIRKKKCVNSKRFDWRTVGRLGSAYKRQCNGQQTLAIAVLGWERSWYTSQQRTLSWTGTRYMIWSLYGSCMCQRLMNIRPSTILA